MKQFINEVKRMQQLAGIITEGELYQDGLKFNIQWYPENETTIKYFTVANDGKIFSDNAHTIGGYKGFYRTIICVPTDLDEFNGI